MTYYANTKNNGIKHSLKLLQNALKRLNKMQVVVVGYHHDDLQQPPIIEALHTDATAGLVMLGKAKLTNHGVDDAGKYGVYDLMLGGVYVRFTVRPG